MNRRIAIKLTAFASSALAASERSPQTVALPINAAGMLPPVSENGFLAFLESDRTTVHLVDLAGNLVGTCRLHVPGASALLILNIGISAAGTIAAAVAAKDDAGRLVPLLTFADPRGPNARIVQLSPFAATRVAFLPGGEIACLGRENDSNLASVPGHEVLRFYSSAGELLRKAVKVEALRPDSQVRHPLNWLMRVDRNKIALLDPKGFRYCEINHSGELMRGPDPSLDFGGPVRITGFALASDGDVVVSVELGKVIDQKTHFEGKTAIYRFPGGVNPSAGRTSMDLSFLPEWAKGCMVAGDSHGHLVALLSPPTHFVVHPL